MSNLYDEIVRNALASRIILISIGVPMLICGMVGSLINSIVFAYLSQFNKLSSSIFLICSYVASEITLISGLLPHLMTQISGRDPLANSVILCKLRWYIRPLAGNIALHCLCFALINQYLMTCRTVQYHQLITGRQAVCIGFFVVAVSMGLISPSIIFYMTIRNSVNGTVCNITNPIFSVYNTYLSAILYSLIPIFILSLFSLLTWKNVRSNLIRCRLLEQTLTRLLLAQIVMVLFTTIPNAINQIYFFYTRTMPKSSLQLARESLVSSIFALFVYSTHSFSFYIYILTSKTFRENIQSIFIIRRQRIQPVFIVCYTRRQRQIRTFLQSRT